MKQMTQEQYLKQPYLCPYCHTTDIEAGQWDGEGSGQEIQCNECGKRWVDVYELVGYEAIAN